MTSTVPPPLSGQPHPPEQRRNGTNGRDRATELPVTHLAQVPSPRSEGADDSADPTARELRELRREMAALRSDYARLRELLAEQRPSGNAPAEPVGSPPTEAIGIVGRVADDEATRPAFRPTPRTAAGRPPAPGPGPANAPRPGPPAPAPAPNRPGSNGSPGAAPRAFPQGPGAVPPGAPARPSAPASAPTPGPARTPVPRPAAAAPPTTTPPATGAGARSAVPSPTPTSAPTHTSAPARPPRPAPAAGSEAAPGQGATRPVLATGGRNGCTPVVPTGDPTTALPVVPTGDQTTALPVIATGDQTTALPVVPTGDQTTALPVVATGDQTTALPVIAPRDRTTALPVVPSSDAPRSPRAPAPAQRKTVPRSPAPGRPAGRPTGPAVARPAPGYTPMPNRPAGPRPDVPATTRLTVVAPAPRSATASGPATGTAAALATVLAAVLKRDSVSPDAHFFDDLGADSMLMAQFCARLRKRADLPTVSIKDVYRQPTITALVRSLPATTGGGSAAGAGMDTVLAEVLKLDSVSPDAHFFKDLGADSMLMAQFCARLRKRADLPTVSIKDVYRHPTITALVAAFGGADVPAPGGSGQPAAPRAGAAAEAALPDPAAAPMSRSKPHFFLCGLLQLIWMLGFPLLMTFVAANGFVWVAGAETLQDVYLRSLAFGSGTFLVTCLVPILLKWTLVGRWKQRQFRVWSFAYLRFWLVRSVIQLNPLARYAGSPIFSLYLRLLGAKIGRGALIFSSSVPVGTDLFTVGAGSVIRKDSVITGYRAMDGVIQIGPVTLGRDAYVGEMTVLDIGTAIGDGAQLGHSSSLHTGQAVPAGERWHGSPAEPTTVDYRSVRSTRLGFLRRFLLPLLQMLFLIGVTLPLGLGLPIVVFRQVPQLMALVGPVPPIVASLAFYRDALLLSTVLFVGFLVLGLLLMITVPRMLRLLVRPDREYRLYGVRYWAVGRIARMTNSRYFVQLLGDSAYIVGYLRAIGYDLGKVVQTGSNFGSDVKHDNPYLSRVGTETVVADGLSFINTDYSSSHFRVSRVAIGSHNFLGNRVAYPSQGRTGDNCLLATKVMVPMDGPIREGVGLLGSPSFEIPRTVDRDHQLDVTDPALLRRRLARKTWHNTVTIVMFLVSRWVLTSAITVLTLAAVDLHSEVGLAVALVGVALLPLTTGYLILLDLLVRRMMVHRPTGCSIYDKAFWRHERFWKLGADRFPQLFNGTPFKSVVWRMLGAKIGKRVFDDGCTFTERRFVTIGDRCTLNAGSVVQCHSQEDGAFKSDRSAIGAGTTLGVGAFVHYGVTIGPGGLLEPDSFLMKGSDVPAGSWWGGNPATELGSSPFGTGSAWQRTRPRSGSPAEPAHDPHTAHDPHAGNRPAALAGSR